MQLMELRQQLKELVQLEGFSNKAGQPQSSPTFHRLEQTTFLGKPAPGLTASLPPIVVQSFSKLVKAKIGNPLDFTAGLVSPLMDSFLQRHL